MMTTMNNCSSTRAAFRSDPANGPKPTQTTNTMTITSGSICTSGFAVEHNDGRDGITAAGQPDKAALEVFADSGYATVIDMRAEDEDLVCVRVDPETVR